MEDKIQVEVNELIQKSQFKQCYDKISQLSKIYKNNQFLKVLDVYVKYKQSPQKFDISGQLVNPFLITKAPITDIKALNLLHNFFVELEMFEEALKIIELANLKQNKLEVTYELFVKSLEDSNFNFLIRSTSALANFKLDDTRQTRSYFFWNAIATIAAFKYQKNKLSEQEISILPLLCYKRLSSLKPFQNLQEVIIYCTFIENFFVDDEGKIQEMINIILPELNVNVDLYLKNFLVRNVKDSQILYDSCHKLLSKIDDFKVIKSLIKSGHQLGHSKNDILNVIENCIGDGRNYRLSQFELDLEYNELSMISEESIKFYLQKFHNKPCCCIDLESYRKHLDMDIVKRCFQELNDDLIHDSNMFQLKLNDEDAISLYKKHEFTLKDKFDTDYSTLSVFIISVVEEILSKEANGNGLGGKLLALSILQNYQNKDKNNFNTKVWLIALYMELGLSSIAITLYQELKIKNVQIDTLDYLIFSRYSTINPHKQHDYLMKILPKNMALYDSNEKLTRFIQISMERATYSKIFGMIELKTQLLSSINRWSNVIENLQLSRLCNDKRNKVLQDLHGDYRELLMINEGEISDNRDFNVFGKRDLTKGDTDVKLDIKSVITYFDVNDKWIKLNILKEFIIENLPQGQKTKQIDCILEAIGISDMNNVIKMCQEANFTAVEQWSFKLFYAAYVNDTEIMIELMQKTNRFDSESSWLLSHNYLTQISTWKTLDNVKRLSKHKSVIKTNLQKLREECDDIYQQYKTCIETECNNLQGNGVLARLEYLPMGHESLLMCVTSAQKIHRNL